mgnify:CR=1 FL=1
MKLLRQSIRKLILEECERPKYWGIAAAGVVMICSEDSSVYLHLRHNGKWAYPGGGIHLGREMFISTPIPEEQRLKPNDLRFRTTAIEELEEEAGYLGLPAYNIVDELVTYEDCGFVYKTFIADISLEEKTEWEPQPHPSCAWEVQDHGWFAKDEWESKGLHRGFTPELVNAIRGRL